MTQTKTLKSPIAPAFQSLLLVRSPYLASRLLVGLLVLLLFLLMGLAFVPWQQTINAYGKVTVFSPMQRPQSINAQIDGRLSRWLVKEGDRVSKGQLLGELQDIKPEYLDPDLLTRYQQQREAYRLKQQAAEMGMVALRAQLDSLTASRIAALGSAGLQIRQALERLEAARQLVISARQNDRTTRLNLDRRQKLFDQGLRSLRDLELAQLDAVKARADLQTAQAQLEIAQNSTSISTLDQSKLSGDTASKLQEVQAKLAETIDKLATVRSDRAKLDVDIANFKARLVQRQIRAPFAGQLARVVPNGQGQTVKAGDVMTTLVPDVQDQAVELFISDTDAPLMSVGKQVRLQFAGWPAIQFMGWPSVSVGTFAGRISVIDAATEEGQKQYRVLVKPDVSAIAAGKEEPWPSSRLLRPGGNARGWILLNRVTLGFELWRQFNGFPATISQPGELTESKDDAKPDKMERKRKK